MTITNRTDDLRLLLVEPQALDFWMGPDETFELCAETDDPDARFEVWDTDEGMTVFASAGMGVISVFCGDRELVCGHQRPGD
jgi:hypothetical protein